LAAPSGSFFIAREPRPCGLRHEARGPFGRFTLLPARFSGTSYVHVLAWRAAGGTHSLRRKSASPWQIRGFVMEDYRLRFQELLRRLFQFESADLDFGIYRIMNFKRGAIEKFIEKDLIKGVSAALDTGALADQADVVEQIKELAEQIGESLGDDAIDGDGNLAAKYHDTKAGRKYLALQAKARGAQARPAVEAAVFNHLYSFFSRYYDAGDFISKRKYSERRNFYAVPYNGEEVYLHWANKDQYYVKTGEHFTDYSFRAPNGVIVHFKLQAASVEKDNVKGTSRFFIALAKDATFDPKARTIVIPFEYRPLTQAEGVKYGQKNQQDAILAEAQEAVPNQVKKHNDALAALLASHHQTSDGADVSFLAHHLRQYAEKNTSDFFVHKNLKGFLTRELDFYLKNEVLGLDEMEAGLEARSDGWFQIMRAIRAIGGRIIDFLAQIEDFQKMLFEKKKLITETQYCITMGNIPEGFYGDIAACEAQWDEWKDLFHIDEEAQNLFNSGAKNRKDRRVAFLKDHPTLVLDTKHFAPGFRDRLLASFDDADGMTDGLLIHGDNFQALSLLLEKYREQVMCIHIDPPYNTQTSGFLYKNDYQHSSWLAMMQNRVAAGVPLLSMDGAYLCHIDENEYELLHVMFRGLSIPDGGTIVWDKKNPMLGRKGIATQHEYVLWRTSQDSPVYVKPTNVLAILDKIQSLIKKHGKVNEELRREFSRWLAEQAEFTGGEKAYRLIDDDGRVYQSVSMGAPEPRTDPKFFIPLIHPVTKKKCPVPQEGWSRTPENHRLLMERDEIIFGQDETVQPRKKVFLTNESKRQLSSVIGDSSRGKNDVDKLGLEFPYCHPVSLYEQLVGAGASADGDVVLDYFAGSGTNGHAVLNLNREDGRRRKFILVEMAEYFDTVLVPRIKKVTFSPEWKDGKPARQATAEEAERSPRIVKYIRLESYEDALNNISFTGAPQTLYGLDDYMLRYMLEWETRESPTLLNVQQLASPFSYKLLITDGQETREKVVDIPETFSYLLGMHVTNRLCLADKDRRYVVYRGRIDHRQVVVIWRDTAGWEKKDYECDKAFAAEQKLTEGADDVFVNGDSVIPSARSLDPLFKGRMFAPLTTNGGN
jgi:adenine-specific DNA-methyltransferase